MPYLDALSSAKNCDRLMPGMPSRNGGPFRSTSGRLAVSVCTTSAP